MDQFTITALFCLLVVVYPNPVQSGYIVGLANHYHSHQFTLRKLGKELVSRGHRYTQLVPHFLAEKLKGIDVKVFQTALKMEEIDRVMIELGEAGDIASFRGVYKVSKLIGQAHKHATQLCQDLLDNKAIKAELKGKVDVFLCDITSTCCFILADMFNATRVDVSSLGFGGAVLGYHLGFPQSPVYLTQETITVPTDPSKFSFARRLLSFIYFCVMPLVTKGMLSEDLWLRYAKPTSQHKNIMDAWRPHNLVLLGHDFALEYPRPMGPHVKVVGAILPDSPQQLPQDLHNYMSWNKNVVLVSLGTAVSDINPELRQVIADGLGKLSAAVLWRVSDSTHLNISQNIRTVSWFPQNDLLGHKSTKVFITHCGLNGVLESVYHGVPMVAIPMFGDQHRQATVIKMKGLGVTLDKNTMKPDELAQAVHEVLTNKLYQENVKRISAIMRDRKRTPTEEGADWIEYAIRHNGAKHLVSEALDLPLYQLFCFDVFLFLLFVAAAIIFICLKFCSFVCQRTHNPDKVKNA